MPKDFADALGSCGVPRKTIARIADTSPRTVDGWCEGVTNPRWPAIKRLAQIPEVRELLRRLIDEHHQDDAERLKRLERELNHLKEIHHARSGSADQTATREPGAGLRERGAGTRSLFRAVVMP